MVDKVSEETGGDEGPDDTLEGGDGGGGGGGDGAGGAGGGGGGGNVANIARAHKRTKKRKGKAGDEAKRTHPEVGTLISSVRQEDGYGMWDIQQIACNNTGGVFFSVSVN